MDSTNTTYPAQEYPPVQPVAELYPVPEVSQQLADVQKYEPYSIAATIHAMFEEAEQQGFDETRYWETTYQEQEYPNDTEAFRMYMAEVHRELKQSSAVQELRHAAEGGQAITTDMVQAVFRAYERVVSSAAEKLRQTLSPGQLNKLKQAGRGNLDWSYRGLLLERLTQPGDAPTKYSLEDIFLILNPKARKVQYMERSEVLKTLNHSMGRVTQEQLDRAVKMAKQYAHQDMAGEIVTNDDLKPFESEHN